MGWLAQEIVGCGPGSFSITGSFLAAACDLSINNCGSTFGVTLGVLGDTSYPASSFSASADPYIQIDPAFLALHPGYSIVVSAGIDNAPISAVPEPSALAIFGVALVGIGLQCRAKKERAPAEADTLCRRYRSPAASGAGSRSHARAAAVAVSTMRCGEWRVVSAEPA